MAESKSFLKKYETAIVVIATFLIIYLLVVFNQKINYILGNDLIVYLTPTQKSFTLNYGNKTAVDLEISIDNSANCRTSCHYSFIDQSKNQSLSDGSFDISKDEKIIKSFELEAKRRGSGQDIYNFELECRSKRSLLCLTSSPEKSRSSFVLANYELTSAEKEIKETMKQDMALLLELLHDVDIAHQKLNQKYAELSKAIEISSLSKEKITINEQYDNARTSVERLRSLWESENYLLLDEQFGQGHFEGLSDVNKSIIELNGKISNSVILHNSLLNKLDSIAYNLNQLNILLSMQNNTTSNFSEIASEFQEASDSITSRKFGSYAELGSKIENLTKMQSFQAEKSKFASAELFFKSSYNLDYEKRLVCSLHNNCIENASIGVIAEKTKNFIDSYPDLSFLADNCNGIKELEWILADARSKALAEISNSSIIFNASGNFTESANKFLENELLRINNSYFYSLENIQASNETRQEIAEIAKKILPKNISNISAFGDESANLSLHLLSKINLSDDLYKLAKSCENLKSENIVNFSYIKVTENITYKLTREVETNISDNPPICCAYNECRRCCDDNYCKNNASTFPTVFVHGHSVASGNSPEFSLDDFSSIQSKLQEEGYLNAGILVYSGKDDHKKGEWGLSGKPVSVRVTYYYDVFREEEEYNIVPTKSEGIDTYAIRLNNVINVVKERTGKPKVNIVAFSMGGLVSRRYLQIFGDSSVHKLITIGTPHNGISGNVAEFCPVVGESKECLDMQETSLFINRLNDPAKQPSEARLYVIIGSGCLRNGKDGDGIVNADQASLKSIAGAEEFFVEGGCSGVLGNFHTDLLDTGKYPRTYEIIKSVLMEK